MRKHIGRDFVEVGCDPQLYFDGFYFNKFSIHVRYIWIPIDQNEIQLNLA